MYPHLEVECLVVDGDGESCHVLIVDPHDRSFQADTASTHALGHFLLGLLTVHIGTWGEKEWQREFTNGANRTALISGVSRPNLTLNSPGPSVPLVSHAAEAKTHTGGQVGWLSVSGDK